MLSREGQKQVVFRGKGISMQGMVKTLSSSVLKVQYEIGSAAVASRSVFGCSGEQQCQRRLLCECIMQKGG